MDDFQRQRREIEQTIAQVGDYQARKIQQESQHKWQLEEANRRAQIDRGKQVERLDELATATARLYEATQAVVDATGEVANSTAQVVDAVRSMDATTTRLMKVSIGVAVAMTLVGAVVGGIAGAVAAQVMGN